MGLSKRVKENKQEKQKKNIILKYSRYKRKGSGFLELYQRV